MSPELLEPSGLSEQGRQPEVQERGGGEVAASWPPSALLFSDIELPLAGGEHMDPSEALLLLLPQVISGPVRERKVGGGDVESGEEVEYRTAESDVDFAMELSKIDRPKSPIFICGTLSA